MPEIIVYAGFSLGIVVIVWALVRIFLDAASTAVNRDEGIHRFVRSFDANQFQDRQDRRRK